MSNSLESLNVFEIEMAVYKTSLNKILTWLVFSLDNVLYWVFYNVLSFPFKLIGSP